MNIITKLYGQTDPRWASQELGYNTDDRFTIGNYGCVVAAIGNLEYTITGNPMYTPAYVNDWGKNNGAFVQGGGEAIWSKFLELGNLQAHGETSSLAELRNWLAPAQNFAIVEFQLIGHQHFCLAPYVDKIIDSEDGLLKPIGTYPFRSAHLYSSTVPAPAPVATPAVAPAQPPHGTVKVTVNRLNLRTEPTSASSLATGYDVSGNPITYLPAGAVVQYVDAVQGQQVGNSNIWLKSVRGHWFWAGGTTYGRGSAFLARFTKKA